MTIIIPNKYVSEGRIIVNVASGWEKNFRELFGEALNLLFLTCTSMKEGFTILKSHTFFPSFVRNVTLIN